MNFARSARLLGLLGLLLLSSCAGRLQEVPASPPTVETHEFATLVTRTTRTPWVEGNSVRTLINGDGYLDTMLEAIRGAKKTITFETFVYKQGTVGRDYSVAMAQAAQRGVKVHVILDANGSRLVNDDDVAMMKAAGVEFYFYRPFEILRPLRYNNRTHRKIMVVDGTLAYTGGAGFANLWLGNAEYPGQWRDTQYEIRGPVVAQIQHVFNNNWKELSGIALSGPDYFPPLRREGSRTAHFSIGAPQEIGDTIGSTYLLAINAARESIYLGHGYFIPTKPFVEALVRALQRGVKVEIVVAGEHTDFPVCRHAQRPALLELTQAGARIWEYQPTMMHGKLLVVDDYFSAVGSANFDPRSFFINDEANLNVLDRGFALEQIRMFEDDRARCKLLTTEDLKFRLRNAPMEIGAQVVKSQL